MRIIFVAALIPLVLIPPHSHRFDSSTSLRSLPPSLSLFSHHLVFYLPHAMDFNATSWDFSPSSSTFSQLAENDFLALLQKQFDPDLIPADAYTIPHDGVDPTKISSLTAAAPPPPLSDDSSPSPPSTTDHLSSSRRQSTNSNNEQDSPELKRKASDDGLDEESPSQKSCKSSHPRGVIR